MIGSRFDQVMTNEEVIKHLQLGKRLENPHGSPLMNGKASVNCPSNLYEIMLSCWKENPKERPTFAHLKKILGGDDVAS